MAQNLGFRSSATSTVVRRYISAVADFHALKCPLVADNVGGLAGLAVAAFGATGATPMAYLKRNVLMFGDGWCESLVEAARAGAYIFRPSIATSRLMRRVLFWR